MNIALIAHDKKKDDLIRLVRAYAHILKHHHLFATGTTGKRVAEATGLPVHCFKSGPLGGDQEIGAAVARGEMDMILFFRDPLTAQPHEPDVSALMRLCDVYSIPLATNMGGSEILVRSIEQGDFEARMLDHNDEPPA
ncbi:MULTISPECIES: methylglyoxal synthase [Exiguobacterium]|uniref:Methylglyoxal synthase n=1 Tax=Exiguobacterium alkaliphilum TaxID=1428684 RepID=A0ABT2KYP1_9BACL|nr:MULTISPECIES: methylglyoxal synthase [Exiguobacterium]MCT4795515.1 methylglyoxal synthase [Exiguobacterium alkaliphilum]QUE86561.1 methylglyoxal synthase [Exiguobacterium alkaliphilum]